MQKNARDIWARNNSTRNNWEGFLPKHSIVMARSRAEQPTTPDLSQNLLQDDQGPLQDTTQASESPLKLDSSTPPIVLPLTLPPATPQLDSIARITADLVDCKRCKLCQNRQNIVVGEGNPLAQLVFVGEGPGEQEDILGRPFVGKAGQLLDRMIQAIGLSRDQVYIANVVKCRPPENRNPEPDEIQTCSPFLYRQLDIIHPKVIVALGKFAAQTLLQTDVSITRMRGKFQTYRGAQLMPTFHPSYLLRNPAAKKEAWLDLQEVARELGLELPKR